MLDALYDDRGGGVVLASELTRGPWDPNAQHGGAPAALLMREFERLDGGGSDELMMGRVTFELLRPVPLGELRVSASVLRPGRRVQLLEGSVFSAEGTEVVRARALRVARAGVSAGQEERVAAEPEAGRTVEFPFSAGRLFPVDAMEIRFVAGSFVETGPSTAWFRLKVPVVAGEPTSGYQRLAAAADFPNGIATELDWERWLFINPDLTIHIEREPVGDWIGVEASMRASSEGCGQSEAVLYDLNGRVGRSLQTLYVAPRP